MAIDPELESELKSLYVRYHPEETWRFSDCWPSTSAKKKSVSRAQSDCECERKGIPKDAK